jgi:hypothetical protein
MTANGQIEPPSFVAAELAAIADVREAMPPSTDRSAPLGDG